MRKLYYLSTLVLSLLIGSVSYAQDFSNKGKDFWIPYPEHIDGNTSVMGIYITSDVNTSGSIWVGGLPIAFNVTANTVTRKFLGPGAGGDAANSFVYMGGITDGIGANKGIRVISLKPVVVFAHIIKSARSGATLVLPTKVWGKEYIVPSFGNTGTSASFGELDIMASIPNTQVEITPSVATRTGGHSAGVPFIITIPNVGDVYQLQFQQNLDLSGTKVKSIASASSGCNPIAVFSATTWSGFPCANASGGDNLYQQLFPTGAWGKEFLTSPLKKTASDNNIDYIKVFVKDPATIVTKTENGATTTLGGLVTPGNYYVYTTFRPTFIQADKPVQVVQYITSQTCGSPQTNSDPEMIVLSSVEQTINNITVFSAHLNFVPVGQSAVTNHFLNVIMKTNNTASFKINGVTPAAAFTPIPGTNYSYLKEDLTTRAATNPVSNLTADSGFSAIAYGFGNVESYGYNAGTNVKDLYQQIGVQTQFGIATTPAVCTGSVFKFKVSLPYCADSLAWNLSNLPGPPVPAFDTIRYSNCSPGPGGPDSTTVVNGKTIYWYSLPNTYTFGTIGTYPVSITAFAPNTDGCGSEQDIDFDLEVTGPPTANFIDIIGGCAAEPVTFNDNTTSTYPTYLWTWDFGDPGSGAANSSTLKNPVHTFSTPGPHVINFSSITTTGCISNTSKTIDVAPLPSATISGAASVCINSVAPVDIIFTGSGGTAPYTFTYTIDPGTGPGLPITVNSTGNTATVNVPTTIAGTFIYTLVSIKNAGSALCTQNLNLTATVIVSPVSVLNLTSSTATLNQAVCVNTAIANITFTVGGGATGATVTGLPAGVNGVYAGGVFTISGTSTTPGNFPYSVSTVGGCGAATLGGTITINPDASLTLTSAAGTTSQTACINTSIIDITYAIGGGGTGATVTGLPSGVTGVYAGGVLTINGTPTVTGVFNYTINTTGTCLQQNTTGSITVNADATLTLTSPVATTTQTLCVNSAITTITYSIGAGGSGATVTGLPPGVTGVSAGGVLTISGTATGPGSFNYTVNTTGTCIQRTATGTITVSANATLTLTSTASTTSQTVCVNTVISNITYAVGGGATGATVTGLPAGITGAYAGGVFTISGATTATGTFNYTITTTGTCTQQNASGTITINADATLTLTSAIATTAQTLCVNNPIANITYSIGAGGSGATVTGLPAGVNGVYAGGVFTISGTPTASGSFPYTVNTTGTCLQKTATGTITVNPNATLTLTSAAGTPTQTACINNAIVNITYAIGGGGTGATITGLPAGVTGIYAGGVVTISGSPTVTGTFNYTINTTGVCLQQNTSGTITVNADATLTLTSTIATTAQTLCVNNPIANITYSIGAGGSGATITGLPAGVNGVYAGGIFTISGTPTVSGSFPYTVNTTGTCLQKTANGTITVNPNATLTLTSAAGTSTQTACINNAIVDITYAIGGGGTGATITGLPAGVTGVYAGGVVTISGSPTVIGTFNYTVNTTGVCIQQNTAGTITVNADASLTLTSAPATNTQNVCINTAIANITYSIAAGGTGATITGLPPGVNGVYAGGIVTISGTTNTTGSFNYTVTTIGSCLQKTAIGTITVNPDATLTLTSAAATTAQEMCFNTPINTISYSIGGSGTGGTVTGLPAGVTGVYAGGVVTISGTATVSGSFNYTVATTGTCLQKTLTGSIIVNALPTANFNFTIPSCETRTITFTDLSVPNAGNLSNWQWDFNDPASGPNNTSNQRNPTHTFATAGSYTVVLNVTTDKGCAGSPTTKPPVVINARPKAGFEPPQVCASDIAAPFRDTSSIAAGNSIVAWEWNFGDANSTPGNPNISNLPNPTHQFTISAPYTTRLVTTSNNGCTDTAWRTFTVNGSIPQAAYIVQNPTALCSNQVVTLKDASTVNSGSLVRVEVYWDYANDPTIKTIDNNPVTGKLYTHTYPEFGTPFNKNVSIKYVVYSGISCLSTVTPAQNITVLATPTLQFDPIPSVCSDVAPFQITQAQLVNAIPGGPGVFSGQGISATGLFTPSAAIIGSSNTLRYTYTATNGCTNYLEQPIIVYQTPGANAGPDKVVLEGGQVTLTPALAASGGNLTYLWSPDKWLNNATIPYAITSPLNDIQYKLTVTGDGGCSATDVVFVTILRMPLIPNIFSPNGDGIHDKWEIGYLETYPGCTVDIFNRYGQLVYHTVGYSKPWDGTVHGQPVPVGTYYYIVDPKNGRKQIAGYVDVIR